MGHFTDDGEHHRPFRWSFSMRDATTSSQPTVTREFVRIEGQRPGVTITDPSCIILRDMPPPSLQPSPNSKHSPPLVGVTESEHSWFRPGGYRLAWYELAGDDANNETECDMWTP